MFVLSLSCQLGGFKGLHNTWTALYSNCYPSSKIHRLWINRLFLCSWLAVSFSIARKDWTADCICTASLNPDFVFILRLSYQKNTSSSSLVQRVPQVGRVWSPDLFWLCLNKGKSNWGAWFRDITRATIPTASVKTLQRAMRLGCITLKDLSICLGRSKIEPLDDQSVKQSTDNVLSFHVLMPVCLKVLGSSQRVLWR